MALTKKNTTHKRTFKHLPEFERGKIKALLEEDLSPAQIAKRLGRHRSTIIREINRGTTTQLRTHLTTYEAYFPETGQAVYESNRLSFGRRIEVRFNKDKVYIYENGLPVDEAKPVNFYSFNSTPFSKEIKAKDAPFSAYCYELQG